MMIMRRMMMMTMMMNGLAKTVNTSVNGPVSGKTTMDVELNLPVLFVFHVMHFSSPAFSVPHFRTTTTD